MDSSTQTPTDDDIKLNSDLFDLAEKLRIELQKKDEELQVKDEELANERQEKQKLSVDLEFEKARANRTTTELASAQEIINAYQMSLWKSFPSPGHSYYIKTQSLTQNGRFHYLYAGQRSSLADDRSPTVFKFTKSTDGTFSIYSTKYLQRNTNSSRVSFTAINESSAEKFVLFFHPQNQHSGLLVDISTLAGYFLYMDNHCLTANSRTPPANKFLIIPTEE